MELLIIIGLAALAYVFLLPKIKAKEKADSSNSKGPQVKVKPLLTENELEFLNRLEAATPEIRFHAQTSMGALLQPVVNRKEDGKTYMSVRGRFSQSMVDFVAQRRDNGQVIALIELDDKTHKIEKDQRRDAMTQEAGYKTIRWDSRKKPSHEEIRKILLGEAKP